MTEFPVFGAVGAMVLCALVKGYTTKAFTQFRQEATKQTNLVQADLGDTENTEAEG